MKGMFTEKEIAGLLRKLVKRMGSQTAVAKHYGITNSYLSDILNGRRKPARIILEQLGFERVSVDFYERVKPHKEQ